MIVGQSHWTKESGWKNIPDFALTADIVFVFADDEFLQTENCYQDLRSAYPKAHIVGCSSSGSISGVRIFDQLVIATAVKLEKSSVSISTVDYDASKNAFDLGKQLIEELSAPDLKHIFVLSDGQQVNGSELANGLNSKGYPITGGLAGDGTRFGKTWVIGDDSAKNGRIVALGFYGDVIIKSGCFSGWEEFGPERIITKSSGNVVYEIDNQPALSLYKKYLGEQSSELPASGLKFPLSIQPNKKEQSVIRTLLAINESENSLTFAGDVPEGYICKLMRTNLDNLIEHAGLAANAASPVSKDLSGLCLVVSCVGRRLVMGQLTEEELEEVQNKVGPNTLLAGFYSYGELAPFSDVLMCQLHNQTMTLTTIYE